MADSGFGESDIPAEHRVGQRLARLALWVPGAAGFKWEAHSPCVRPVEVEVLLSPSFCRCTTLSHQSKAQLVPGRAGVGCRQPGAEFLLCTSVFAVIAQEPPMLLT